MMAIKRYLSPPDASTEVTRISNITSVLQPTKTDISPVRNISMTICEKQYKSLCN